MALNLQNFNIGADNMASVIKANFETIDTQATANTTLQDKSLQINVQSGSKVNDLTIATTDITNGIQTDLDAVKITYSENSDIYSEGFILDGFEASIDGVVLNQLNLDAGKAILEQTNGKFEKESKDAINFTADTSNVTYYLYLQPDKTFYWATTDSPQANSLALYTVDTDGSGDLIPSSLIDKRNFRPKIKYSDRLIFSNVAELKTSNWLENLEVVTTTDNNFIFDIVDSPTLGGITIDYEDELHLQLANGKYAVLRIDSTVIEYAKKISNNNYNEAITKLKYRQGSVQINCYGDSTTFGLGSDVVKIGDPTNFGDGSTYAHDQISDPYPSQLQDKLQELYGGMVTVKNLGYSGDRVSNGYHRYRNTEAVADFSIFMYGINDVQFATNNGLNPENLTDDNITDSIINFRNNYRKFLVRQMLRGNNIILALPINFVSGFGFDGTQFSSTRIVEEYRKVAFLLGEELGITVIETDKFFDDYDIFDITLDSLHPNVTGYDMFSARLASIFVGNGYKKPTKINGEKIITATNFMESLDGNLATGVISAKTTTELYTPEKFADNAFKINVDTDKVCIPFYCEHDNTELFVWGINMTVDLDFAVAQGAPRLSYDQSQIPNVATQTLGGTLDINARKTIKVNGKGWHNITLHGAGIFYAIAFNKEYFKKSITISDETSDKFFEANSERTLIRKRKETGSNLEPVTVEENLHVTNNANLTFSVYLNFNDIPAGSWENHLIEIDFAGNQSGSGIGVVSKLRYRIKSFTTLSGLALLYENTDGGVTAASIVGNKLKVDFTESSVAVMDYCNVNVKVTSSMWTTTMTGLTLS